MDANFLIRAKIRPPAIAEGVVARPRLQRSLHDSAEGRRLLLVVAPAGSGKTTAMVQFISSRPGPCAWMTLRETDDSPARFLLYLAAAVAAVDPDAVGRARSLLEGRAAPADCAAVLAEDIAPGTTVVIDDLHHVESRVSLLPVLRAFLRVIGDGVLVVLISRNPIVIDLSRQLLEAQVGSLAEGELAFRVEEISDLLAARGLPGMPEDIEASSGGWAAGIVFEALRIGRTGSPILTTEDPFFSYLGSEVLGTLPLDLRRMVLFSALFDAVNADRLGRLLGGSSAVAVLEAISRNHFPTTQEPEGVHYHPRFREFLLARLQQEYPGEVRALTARSARILLSEGNAEDAVDGLLRAGELDEAADLIEAAAPALLRRGDSGKVLSWCSALGDELISSRSRLREHQLISLSCGRRHREIIALVRSMQSTGEYGRLVAEAPDAACVGVEALHLPGHWDSLLSLIPPDESSPFARALRYTLTVGSADHPPREWDNADLHPFTLSATIVQAGFYFRGRLAQVERFAMAAARHGPVAQSVAEVFRVAALRQRGNLAEARRILEISAASALATAPDLWKWSEAELVFAETRGEEGLSLVKDARMRAAEQGHEVADNAIFAIAQGKMLLRLGMLSEAVDLLATTREWCIARALPCFRESADTWLAAARLRRGEPAIGSARLLEEAIRGMERADRCLELPAAHVFLAEARWRDGDEAGHDSSAALAYTASVAMGSLSPLLAALEEVPDVLTRKIDAEAGGEGTWRSLARAYVSFRARLPAETAPLIVRTFGRISLEAGGRELSVAPPKAIELAAAVARAAGRGASRDALVAELFDESADAPNYLRQLAYLLRRVLPPGVELAFEGGRFIWLPAGSVLAEDQILESLIARAQRETGRTRLETLAGALEIADRGLFLPGVEHTGARGARDRLAGTIAEARREYAELLIAAGRPARAAKEARTAVLSEPYREDGWQVLMRADVAAKGPAAAVPVYLDCARALREVGLEPTPRTRNLLDHLRGILHEG